MYCPKCGAQVGPGLFFCPTCGANLGGPAQSQQPVIGAAPYATPYATQPMWDYATWGTRVLGYLIDFLLIGVGMVVLYFVLAGILAGTFHLAGGREAGQAMCCTLIMLFPLATFLVGIYNSVILIAERGYSIGQGVVKIMVVDANGARLTAGSAFIRLLVRVAFGFVPLLPTLDLLWPLWDVRRQTLHDKAVNCYVINMR